MEFRTSAPEITFGTLGKVVSTSAKKSGSLPSTAQITVLFDEVTSRRAERRSTTFHVHLGQDGNYHYKWLTHETKIDPKDGKLRTDIVEHDFKVSSGFILSEPRSLAKAA